MTPPEPEFMDPPPAYAKPQDEEWAPTITTLITNSGRWARILIGDYKDAGRLAGRIRKSRGGWAGHEWEVATRNSGNLAAIHVYARHVRALSTDTPNDEGDNEQ